MYKNEVFLILSIIDNKNMEDLANIYDIKPTKIWNKGDFRVKGSILKHKDFGFTIEKKYKNGTRLALWYNNASLVPLILRYWFLICK